MKSCAVSKLRLMPVYEASAVVGKDSAKEAARVATVFRDKTGKGLFLHAMVYGIASKISRLMVRKTEVVFERSKFVVLADRQLGCRCPSVPQWVLGGSGVRMTVQGQQLILMHVGNELKALVQVRSLRCR